MSHLYLVSDYPLRSRPRASAMEDYVTLMAGWQLATMMLGWTAFAMGIGYVTSLWLR